MEAPVDLLRALADRAADTVDSMSIGDRSRAAGIGADGRPTRHVDREAEAAILDELDTRGVDLNVCSEELGRREADSSRTLVVDPVDGTRNAARGVPFYCVSLALTPGGVDDVDVGLVRNLATGDEFVAKRGEGARCNREPIETKPFDPDEAIFSPSGQDPAPALDAQRAQATHRRDMGAAALEICLVAQGALDAYIHTDAALRVVDIAAAQLILHEAGGKACRADGSRVDVALNPTDQTDLVAVGDPSLFADREVSA
jgi:fructose-1,6-bisphosphatase/inositol monophosphatase family enzyme